MSSSAKIILGIDEVGRGPWAGPLVVGAVILGREFTAGEISEDKSATAKKSQVLQEKRYLWENLADSKKLSAKKRTELSQLIHTHAAAGATGWVSAAEIDRLGLSSSLRLATRRAVKQILAQKVEFTEIIIDGTINFLSDTPLADRVTVLKKGDSLIKEISAASIIAKVARDAYMAEIAPKYPAYGFEKHVGYGTALHRSMLEKHGICPEHRKSFRPVAKIIAEFEPKCPQTNVEGDFRRFSDKPPLYTANGKKAENAVAAHLRAQNHEIIAQNYQTKTAEIDLISVKDRQIFFTEVKYSASTEVEGSPLVRITPKKRQQMTYAAELFHSLEPKYRDFEPIMAVAAVTGQNFDVEFFALDD